MHPKLTSSLACQRAWPSCSRRTCQQTDLAAGTRDDLLCPSSISIHSTYPLVVANFRQNMLWKSPADSLVSCGVVFGLMWCLVANRTVVTPIFVQVWHAQVLATVVLGVGYPSTCRSLLIITLATAGDALLLCAPRLAPQTAPQDVGARVLLVKV